MSHYVNTNCPSIQQFFLHGPNSSNKFLNHFVQENTISTLSNMHEKAYKQQISINKRPQSKKSDWPVSEEFNNCVGSRGVPENLIEIGGVQINGGIMKIRTGIAVDVNSSENITRSNWNRRRRRAAEEKQNQRHHEWRHGRPEKKKNEREKGKGPGLMI